jgi:hypothetical protein
MNKLNDKFVIMAGSPKCGSTSLFEYMNAHPKIAGAFKKEPNYFIPPELKFYRISVGSQSKVLAEHIQDYLKAFPTTDGQGVYRLDGSIEYCNSWKSADAIFKNLSDVKLIFIFRNPVDRFISLYQFHKQTHRILENITLEQYMQGIDDYEEVTERAYSAGKYAERLRPFWERFDQKNILLLSFSELKNNPLQLMQKVCTFLDIDATLYDNYKFTKHNVTLAAKNKTIDRIQYKIIARLRRPFLRYPQLFYYLRAIHLRTWVPLYQRLNGKAVDKNNIPSDAIEFLRDYYKDEARLLYELTGVDGLLD